MRYESVAGAANHALLIGLVPNRFCYQAVNIASDGRRQRQGYMQRLGKPRSELWIRPKREGYRCTLKWTSSWPEAVEA